MRYHSVPLWVGKLEINHFTIFLEERLPHIFVVYFRFVSNCVLCLRNVFSVLCGREFANVFREWAEEKVPCSTTVRNLLPTFISSPGRWVLSYRLIKRSHNQVGLKMLLVDFRKLCCVNRKILKASRTRQTSHSSWEFLKIENEHIKQLETILMDKKLRETTNYLCVEIMNSERQEKGKLGHVVQIRVCRLT